MRKLTAIILSVIMLITVFPLTSFATGEKVIMVDDAKDFAKITGENSYILTKNIELGSEWETIGSFSGTLDGNGYTVTVPTNAPIFEVISGTVKNLNLIGTMSLTDEDVSRHSLDVYNIKYALGVLANRAIGATVDNVHSNVNVAFNQSDWEQTVVFGGMIGAAYPYYDFSALEKDIKNIRKTTINGCFIGGSIVANYQKTDDKHQIDSVGGLIALATCDVDVSNTQVSADITVNNASGYVGGIIAVQYAIEIPALDKEGSLHKADIANMKTALEVSTITNCLVSGSFLRTADGSVERSGGIVGFAQGVDIKACAYNGTAINDQKGEVRTILAWGESDNEEWYYIKINSCVATLGDKRMISVKENTESFENVIVWGSASTPVTNNTGNDTGNGLGIKQVNGGQEAALQTFASDNAPAFSYEEGKLILKTVTPPSPDHSHKISVSTEVDGKLSTGMCTDTEDNCNYVTGDPYAGFVQFSSDGKKLRVIMVVSEEELGDIVNKKLKSLKMKVTIENQSVEISGEKFTAYSSVMADGKEYAASDGYYIFGVIFEFKVDMSSTNPSVTIIYEGETEPVFVGSVKNENTL